jgi:hypothetical protein
MDRPLKWKVQLRGTLGDKRGWELAVVREDCDDVQRYYGWFDEKKLLVSHENPRTFVPMVSFVYNAYATAMLQAARELCARLNAGSADYAELRYE